MDAKASSGAGGCGRFVRRGVAGRCPGLPAGIGPGRIAALGGVALALAAFFAFIIWRASAPDCCVRRARAQRQPAPRPAPGRDGRALPAECRRRCRHGPGRSGPPPSHAVEGMPVGSAVGYELLDRAGPFGTSELQANINLHRAIEGELARDQCTLRQVRSARVRINLPRRELLPGRTVLSLRSSSRCEGETGQAAGRRDQAPGGSGRALTSRRSRSPWSTTAATCWPRARARAASLPAMRRSTGLRSRSG